LDRRGSFDVAAALAEAEDTEFVGRPEEAQEWANVAQAYYVETLRGMLTIKRQKEEIEAQNRTVTRVGKVNEAIAYTASGEMVLIILLVIALVLRTA